MKTQAITTEFADQWPLQPWAAAVRTGAAAAEASSWAPSTGSTEAEAIRRGRDGGASAVEWVVITAIVVAIVGVVGGIIYNAVKGKATETGNNIQNTNVTNNSTGL